MIVVVGFACVFCLLLKIPKRIIIPYRLLQKRGSTDLFFLWKPTYFSSIFIKLETIWCVFYNLGTLNLRIFAIANLYWCSKMRKSTQSQILTKLFYICHLEHFSFYLFSKDWILCKPKTLANATTCTIIMQCKALWEWFAYKQAFKF